MFENPSFSPPRRPGAQPGNRNACKHGFYTRKFKKTELQGVDTAEFIGLSQEIRILRLYVRLIVESGWAADGGLDLVTLGRLLCQSLSTLNRLVLTHDRLAHNQGPVMQLLNQTLDDLVEEGFIKTGDTDYNPGRKHSSSVSNEQPPSSTTDPGSSFTLFSGLEASAGSPTRTGTAVNPHNDRPSETGRGTVVHPHDPDLPDPGCAPSAVPHHDHCLSEPLRAPAPSPNCSYCCSRETTPASHIPNQQSQIRNPQSPVRSSVVSAEQPPSSGPGSVSTFPQSSGLEASAGSTASALLAPFSPSSHLCKSAIPFPRSPDLSSLNCSSFVSAEQPPACSLGAPCFSSVFRGAAWSKGAGFPSGP